MKILYVFLFISIASAQVFVSPMPTRRGTASSPPAENVTLRDSARYVSTNIGSAWQPMTITSGTNKVLFVAVIRASAPAGGRRDTMVTWDDVALTFVDSVVSGNDRVEWWRLINPTAKADTVRTFCNSTASHLSLWSVVYSGVNQTTPNGAVNRAVHTNSTTPSVDITTSAGDTTIAVVAVINSSTIAVGTNQTVQANLAYNGGTAWMISTEGATGATTTMNHTLGTSTRWVTSGFAIKKN